MGLLAADAGGVAFELPTLGDECCELQQGGGSGRVEGGAEYQLLVHGRQSVRKRDACGQTKFNGISKKKGEGWGDTRGKLLVQLTVLETSGTRSGTEYPTGRGVFLRKDAFATHG